MVNTTESDSTISSCTCNVHQEHLLELNNNCSASPLPIFENMMTDSSGNCVICNFNISSSACTRCHDCACPSDASITLESFRSTTSSAPTTPKHIGPTSFENLDEIVSVTDCDSQTNRSNSEVTEALQNLDAQFSYTKHEKDDMNYFLQNTRSYKFNTENTIADAIVSHMTSSCLWDIDNLIQAMTDSNLRVAQWVADTSKNTCPASDSVDCSLNPSQIADSSETMPNYSEPSDIVLDVGDSKSKKEYMNQCLVKRHNVWPTKKEDE